MPRGPLSADDVMGEALRVFARRLRSRQSTVQPAGTATGGTGGTGTSGWLNPMRAIGDLIRGGESGAAVRLPAGNEGDVLTMVAGVPTWRPPNVGGSPVVDHLAAAVTDNSGNAVYAG